MKRNFLRNHRPQNASPAGFGKQTRFAAIALIATSMAGAGCRTHSPDHLNRSAEAAPLALPPGGVVHVCLPEEGRYPQVLFRAPDTARSVAKTPRGWRPDRLSIVHLRGDPYTTAIIVAPALAAFWVHSFVGPVLHKTVGRPTPYPQEEQSREIAAMLAAAKSRSFEHDLKQALVNELQQHGLAATTARTVGASTNPVATLNVYIVAVGMMRDTSFN